MTRDTMLSSRAIAGLGLLIMMSVPVPTFGQGTLIFSQNFDSYTEEDNDATNGIMDMGETLGVTIAGNDGSSMFFDESVSRSGSTSMRAVGSCWWIWYLSSYFGSGRIAEDGDKFYISYYIYFPAAFNWGGVPETGWKQFRADPPDGWPILMIKHDGGGFDGSELRGHCYYSGGGLSDDIHDSGTENYIPQWRAFSVPPSDEWVRYEIWLSYSSSVANPDGGFEFRIDGELAGGAPRSTHFVHQNLPRDSFNVSEVTGFRFISGNGSVSGNSTHYVDDIEIWSGWPTGFAISTATRTGGSAAITWNDTGADSYQVQVDASGVTIYHATTTGTTITIPDVDTGALDVTVWPITSGVQGTPARTQIAAQ